MNSKLMTKCDLSFDVIGWGKTGHVSSIHVHQKKKGIGWGKTGDVSFIEHTGVYQKKPIAEAIGENAVLKSLRFST